MDKKLFVVLVCFFAAVLMGCSTLSGNSGTSAKSAFLEPQSVVKFSDVPVPAGFSLDYKDSYSFESSGVRVGVLRYTGKATTDQVINFYKEQMPMYNWRLLNVVEFGDSLLNFDRDTETCIVRLLPKGNNIILGITLGPKSQAVRKAEKSAK
ncbi:MAG: hypothetical protein HZC15_01250 [Candidatus Omnitrophica bacterium]|jgi:hypothetical protein|nr:hypothetical protein [Candidatus Omnitrophota bacterium]